MKCQWVLPVQGDPNRPGFYYARVSSDWLQANWKPSLDANRAIVVWASCFSATASGTLPSLKEGAGGRWRIGYLGVTLAQENYFVNDEFFRNMNGKLNGGLCRTAGEAYANGAGYT